LHLLATLSIRAFSNSGISMDVSSALWQPEKNNRSTDHLGLQHLQDRVYAFLPVSVPCQREMLCCTGPAPNPLLLVAPMVAGCPRARLTLNSQVWVPTTFVLGLAIRMPWYFAAGPDPLAQDLAPLSNKGVPQRCRTRLCPVCPGDFWKKPTLSFAKRLI